MMSILVLTIFIGLSLAGKCPYSPPLTQIVNYDLIKGPWILAANLPEFDEKCKNLTFLEKHGNFSELDESLFMSNDKWKHETNKYIVTISQNSPTILLENKSTQGKVKLFLVDGDYNSYIIFYSCDDSTGTASEAWEIWSRGIIYEAGLLPQMIRNTLDKLKLKAKDFSYRTASDCNH